MYSLTVVDHIMVAHSFRGAEFGPAQRLHGATFVLEAEFRAETIDHLHLLIDIGLAKDELRKILAAMDYRNLDAEPEFAGKNTTTEFLCKVLFDRLAIRAKAGDLGRAGKEIAAIRVTIGESHTARAAYEGPLA